MDDSYKAQGGQSKRSPMREFRLAQKAHDNATNAVLQANDNLLFATRRLRAASAALEYAEKAKCVLNYSPNFDERNGIR